MAALAGEILDFPPVSVWRHFPERDQSAADLAASTLEWQQLLQLDFIKLMPPGDYATIDWGATSEYQGAAGGTRTTTQFPIQSPDDWANISPIAVDRGFNAEVIGACRLVRQALGDLPILQTIFSPLTIAHKLSGGRVISDLRTNPAQVHAALAVLREVTIAVTSASLEAGASGVFFASQCATSDMVSRDEYAEFGVAYDVPVLRAAEGRSEFTLIHIHGANTYFDVLAGYPGHALNWHDRRIGPAIAEVLKDYPTKAAVAGVDEHGIVSMTSDAVREQVFDARDAANGRRLLIGPGCVVPVATPVVNLAALVGAAREQR